MKNNTKEILIKIEGEEWKKALDDAYKNALKNTKIDGFRKGKAPKDIFLKKYGEQTLYFDAADLVLNSAYLKVFEKNKDLELIARPEVDVKKIDEDGVHFNFILTLKPEVKLGEYKNLGIKKTSVKVSKKEVEDAIEAMRRRFAENVVKDGEIALGDVAIIDFEGFKDDVPFEGGKAENYSLTIGSNTFIPGFEDALIGMKAGDEKDVSLKFPEDYHAEDLKGKDVVFKVKINEVKGVKIPEIDKEFFEDLNYEGVTSKEELEKTVKENIRAQKEVEAENKYLEDVLEAAAKNMEVEIPDIMIEDELNRIVSQYEEHLRMQGITLEQFYQFTQSDEDALREQMRPEAVKRVTYRLMLEEIAKVEKIEVTEEEAKEEAKILSEEYGLEEEEFLNMFGGLEMVKYDKQMKNAIQLIREN